MRRREYIIATSGAALGTTVAGCLGGGGSTGTLATEVTDQPGDIEDFESCVVTITGIRVKPSTDDGATDTEGTAMEDDAEDDEGEAPLKFDQSFEIRSDSRTVFTADFTPVKRGQAGGYILQPVADGTEVSYEE